MTKTSSGYRITVTAFIAADPGDIDSLDRAVSHMRTIKTAIGRSPLLSSVALTYLWVQRHKIESGPSVLCDAPSVVAGVAPPDPAVGKSDGQPAAPDADIPEGPSGTAREAPSAGVQPAAPPTDDAPLPESAGGGECRHRWVQSDEPSRRLCASCGVVDDLLDLTGTPLDRRARA